MSDVSLLLDIRGRNVSALRAIAGTKAALKTLSSEERRQLGVNRELNRVHRDVNRSLDLQSRRLKTLTLDYVSLRKAVLSTAVRGAVTGFSALTSVLTATGAAAVATTASLSELSAAVALTGSQGALAAAQGYAVLKGSLKGVGKALVTTGTEHEKAMRKLTKPARELVRELAPLRKELRRLQLISQEGISPGLTKGVHNAKEVIGELEQATYDTARALGYLAEKAGTRLSKNQSALNALLQDNVVTLRRGGEAAIELAEGYIHLERSGHRALDTITSETLNWARETRRAIEMANADGSLADYFARAEYAWRSWTSTTGATGGIIAGTFKAIEPTVRRTEDSINDAAKAGERWVKSTEGQEKIQDGFERLEPVMSELSKSIGATGLSLLRIGDHGADSAVRILRGYRGEVLPLIEKLTASLNDGLLQTFIDLAREGVRFIDNALPGIKAIAGAVGFVGKGLVGGIGLVNDGLERMPKLMRTIAGPGALLAVLVGWSKLKRIMGEALLSMRQMVGLAPRIRGPEFHPTGGVTPALAVGGGRGGGGTRIVSGGGRGGLGYGGSQFPYGTAVPRPGMRPIYTNRGSGVGAPWFVGRPNAMPYTQPYAPAPTRVGGLLARMGLGPSIPQSPGAGYRRLIGAYGAGPAAAPVGSSVLRVGPNRPSAAARLSSQHFDRVGNVGLGTKVADTAGSMARTTSRGIVNGAKIAAPAIGRVLGPVAGIAIFSGLIGALSGRQGELGRTFKGMVKNFGSGATFGAIESTDSRANRIVTEAQRAIRDRGRVNINKDQPAGFHAPPLNLNTVKGVDTFRLKWLTILRDGKKITDDQFTTLKTQADQLRAKLASRDKLKSVLGIDFDVAEIKKGTDFVTSQFEQFRKRSKSSIGDVRGFVRNSMKAIRSSFVKDSAASKEASSAAFQEAVIAIKHNMNTGVISVRKGMTEIRKLHERNLQLYGFSKHAAANYARPDNVGAFGENERVPQTNNGTGSGNGAPGGFGNTAARGMVRTIGRKGAAGRDKQGVNIVAGSGETAAVFTRHQKKVVDGRLADVGGLEGLFGAVTAKHSDPAAGLQAFARGGIVGLGRQIMKRGPYKVGQHPAFGGVGQHTKGSLHYTGNALDINADGAPGGEAKWLDRLAQWLGSEGWHYLWRVQGHQDHLHVDTGSGIGGDLNPPKIGKVKARGREMTPLMRTIAQGAINSVRKTANHDLSARWNFESPSSGGVGAGSLGRAEIRALMRRHGFPQSELRRGSAIALAESSGNPFAQNSIGATGLWQILLSAHPSMTEADAMNPDLATEYAHKLWSQYGWQPWEAYTNGNYKSFMARGGLVSMLAAAAGAVPPRGQGVPEVDTNDAITPGSRGGKNKPGAKKPKKPKKPKKKDNKPIYRKNPVASRRVNQAIGDSKTLIKRGRRGKMPKLPVSTKLGFLQYLLKGGKWIDDPTFTDPITGEPLEPEQMPMFSVLRQLREDGPKLDQVYQQLVGKDGVTEEFSTYNLTGDDLRAYLAKQGFSKDEVQSWIIENGDGLEVANPAGLMADGKWRRGISDAVDELTGQKRGRLNVLDNWSAQKSTAEGIDTAGPLGVRRARLREIRDIFRSHVKVIRRYRRKLRTYGKKRPWKTQIDDNKSIIDSLSDHLRASKRLPDSYKEDIREKIDDLQDLNRDLREKKPKRVTIGQARVEQRLNRALREQRIIAGDEEATQWAPASLGGLAGSAFNSVATWKAMDSYRNDIISEANPAIVDDRDITIPGIQAEIDKLSEGIKLPPLKKAPGQPDADKEHIHELTIQKQTDELKGLRLELSQLRTVGGFGGLLNGRYLGMFAQGTMRVSQDGLALVHKNESIVPSPDGAFRTNKVSRAFGHDGGTMQVEVVVRSVKGEVLEIVRSEFSRNGQQQVSADTGRKTRARAASPGR